MIARNLSFDSIIEMLYNLPLDDKLEIKDLLEHNIADARRSEIADNYKKAQKEQKTKKLKFSAKVSDLKKML